jgi:hypothetical protein
MNRRIVETSFFVLILLFAIGFFETKAQFQGDSYELKFAPDLWYNDVDGIRAGVRMRGQMAGTFDDGPHRLDTGLWLGLWFPKMPISYFVRYTQPIASISDFNSEGSVGAQTSFRTGFHRHGLRLNKRWQQGFNEDVFTDVSVFTGAHKHINKEYLAFPVMFQSNWVGFLNTRLRNQSINDYGTVFFGVSVNSGFIVEDDFFLQAKTEVRYSSKDIITERIQLRARLSAGAESPGIPSEYAVLASMASPIEWMDSGFYRAKGTIPTPWMSDGLFQFTGSGPNMRGYAKQDAALLLAGGLYSYEFYAALNVEMDYPNAIDLLFSNIPVLGDFLRLRSYLFFDTVRGSVNDITQNAVQGNRSDAGTGLALTLNIPDQLGNPRGFVLRYDVPFWLSDPGFNENEWKYRSVFSFGAVIGF